MYLINIIYSEGLNGGRESLPIASTDPYVAAVDAYGIYKTECEENASKRDSDMVGFEEFYRTMESGFGGEDAIEVIQLTDSHIQFEASRLVI